MTEFITVSVLTIASTAIVEIVWSALTSLCSGLTPPPSILRILKMLYMSLSHLFQEQILNLSSLTRTLSNSSVFYIFLKLEPGENRNLLFWSFSHFSKKCSQVSLKWVPCLGTMSWCLGTNETLASKHDIAKGQTKALSRRRPSWFFTIFFVFYYG